MCIECTFLYAGNYQDPSFGLFRQVREFFFRVQNEYHSIDDMLFIRIPVKRGIETVFGIGSGVWPRQCTHGCFATTFLLCISSPLFSFVGGSWTMEARCVVFERRVHCAHTLCCNKDPYFLVRGGWAFGLGGI